MEILIEELNSLKLKNELDEDFIKEQLNKDFLLLHYGILEAYNNNSFEICYFPSVLYMGNNLTELFYSFKTVEKEGWNRLSSLIQQKAPLDQNMEFLITKYLQCYHDLILGALYY